MSELTTETIKALAAEAKKWCGRRTDDPKSWDVFCTTHEWWQLLDALERGDLLPRMKPEEVEAAVQAMAREFSWRYANRDASPVHSMAAVAREALTRYAVQQASEDYCGSFAAQGIGALRARVEAAERERDERAKQVDSLQQRCDELEIKARDLGWERDALAEKVKGEVCSDCNGTGAASNGATKCGSCAGDGRINWRERSEYWQRCFEDARKIRGENMQRILKGLGCDHWHDPCISAEWAGRKIEALKIVNELMQLALNAGEPTGRKLMALVCKPGLITEEGLRELSRLAALEGKEKP